MSSNNIQSNRLQHIKIRREELYISIKQEINLLKKIYDDSTDINFEELEPSYQGQDIISITHYKKLKDQITDKDFVNRVDSLIKDIPSSDGTQYFKSVNVKIGLIADEFLFNSYKDIADFYFVNKDNYRELKLDILIIATTWRGIDNSWSGMGNPGNTSIRNQIDKIITFFRRGETKIVFYSKEDPTNYERFVDIAKKCDYIFTTAKEKVNDYINDCSNKNVFVLEFGVNPVYNNPIGLTADYQGINGAIFAGSWYEKYPNRIKDTRKIFDGVIASEKELKVIDRNYDKNLRNHLFPLEYLQYVSPSINHAKLQKVMKLFPWSINLNSVQSSETMFANRVYELQAMGNLILSNYSVGINNLFPNIFIIQNSNEVKRIMNHLSEKDQYAHQMYGVRKVMDKHTTFHRLNTLFNKIGFKENVLPQRKVAVVVSNLDDNSHIENFNRQSYEYKKLITKEELDKSYSSFDYVTFFNRDYEYGEYYLEDLVNGFKYTNSSFITKDSYYDGGNKITGIEHNFVDRVKDKYKTLFSTEKYTSEELLLEKGIYQNGKGYSIDNLELNINPSPKNTNTQDLKLSVIIPVYNNGEHLYGKCFLSLLRSSMFKNMDIILIDDGSTDIKTLKMVDRLHRLYSNVQIYKFNDGGSGSASRPRNKGIELAKTNYITYLDPDNEAINDGYYQLFKELQDDSELDLVVGDIIKIDEGEKELNYSKNAFNWDNTGTVTDTYDFLKFTNLRAQSIQALIVKKDVIIQNDLKMVEKAVGQDTLFFQELILNCSKIKAIRLVIHIYFAAVSNSVTNTISKTFFERYHLLEKERYIFLKTNSLLDNYVSNRFLNYFVGWYFVRVPRLKQSDSKESLDVLYEIYNLYKPHLKRNTKPLEQFEICMRKQDYEGFVNYCIDFFKRDGYSKYQKEAVMFEKSNQ